MKMLIHGQFGIFYFSQEKFSPIWYNLCWILYQMMLCEFELELLLNQILLSKPWTVKSSKMQLGVFLNVITFKTAEIPNGFIFYDICVIEFLKLNFCKFFRMIPRVAGMISSLTSGDWFFPYSNQVEN